jgi:Ca2+-binding EF-hand superfamily protein
MIQVDVDKSGNVDYTEFLATMMNKHKVKKEEDLLLPFQHFDKDNNG